MSRSATWAPPSTPAKVRSVPIDDPGDLLARLPRDGALCWIRGNDGLVAWGQAARLAVTGPARFSTAADWWQRYAETLDVEDLVGVPGSGPVAFASFTFSDGPSESVFIVPRVVIGRRDGAAWITTIGDHSLDLDDLLTTTDVEGLGKVTYRDGEVTSQRYEQAVAAAVDAIRAGTLEKVVLARDLVATAEHSIDPRAVLRPLNDAYPSCWTYVVEGLVGATPELLVRRTGDHVGSRVLAGTIGRDSDAVVDAQHAAELASSAKDGIEHELAVRSVAEALAPFCSDLVVPRVPEVVRLANVQHLQTDITGRLANGETALDLAASLHPSAAVCGTPTRRAFAMIEEFEAMDRGRYSGPVGWVDARGDGAFGIALRCAQLDPDDQRSARLFAGCGIVEASQPAAELAESQTKFLAIREALEAPEK